VPSNSAAAGAGKLARSAKLKKRDAVYAMASRSLFVVTLFCLILTCESFSPNLFPISKGNRLGLVSVNRPNRIVPKASLSFDNVMAKATNLLLALESEGEELESAAEKIYEIKGIHLYASKVHILRL
jgi:hypothetical protein